MKKHLLLISSISLLVIFIIFTILVKTVDVHYIYNRTYLGFYSLNIHFGDWALNFGKYEFMQKMSSIILYVSFGYSGILAIAGIVDLIRKKSLKTVDKRFYLLLGGYIVIVLLYLFFELVKVNYSPDSYANHLKASYPSSHVFIGCSLLLLNSYTAIKLLNPEKKWLSYLIYGASILICLLLTFTRALSLKHWLTDIIASIILVIAVFTSFIYISHRLVISKEETSETEKK